MVLLNLISAALLRTSTRRWRCGPPVLQSRSEASCARGHSVQGRERCPSTRHTHRTNVVFPPQIAFELRRPSGTRSKQVVARLRSRDVACRLS
ncbi:hypothetical protein BJ912DRAFT_534470 [Pholiota molesta]|nr:hypothetical protein BJ912DRAFT_534470 [Pholiota molesta]